MKKLANEHPVICSVFGTLIYMVLAVASMLFIKSLPGTTTHWPTVMRELILAIYATGLVVFFGQSYIFKKFKNVKKGILVGLVPIIIAVFILISNFVGNVLPVLLGVELSESIKAVSGTNLVLQEPSTIISFIIFILLVGVAEEFTYRGAIGEKLIRTFGTSKNGILKAVCISSLLFGFMHMGNFFQTGFVASLIQSVNAGLMGGIFVMIFYTTRNIWIPVLIHAFYDFSLMYATEGFLVPEGKTPVQALFGDGSVTIGPQIAIFTIVFGVTLFVLLSRKKNYETIRENYKDIIPAEMD